MLQGGFSLVQPYQYWAIPFSHQYAHSLLQPEPEQVTMLDPVKIPVQPPPAGGVGMVRARAPMSQPVAVKTAALMLVRIIRASSVRRFIVRRLERSSSDIPTWWCQEAGRARAQG